MQQNLLIGAINADNGKPNSILNKLTGAWEDVPRVAAHYRDNGVKWAVVAGDNYGEGSSREAAALSPRYMGGFAVLANSMARIHETVSAYETAQGLQLALTMLLPPLPAEPEEARAPAPLLH